jgi:hypothetical protein
MEKKFFHARNGEILPPTPARHSLVDCLKMKLFLLSRHENLTQKKDQNATKKHFSPPALYVGYFMQITQFNVRRKLFFLRELISRG